MFSMVALKALWSTWGRVIIAVLATAALCLPLAYCQGRADGSAVVRADVATATVEALGKDSVAKGAAELERSASDASINTMERELNAAVQNLPDGTPSARRRALACERLRRDGHNVADLPACRGYAGGGEAAPRSVRAR